MADNMARGDAEAFAERLAELEETGATVLVAAGDEPALTAVSSQLLGDQSADREPVFALLGRDRSVAEERLGGDAPLDGSRTVEYGFRRSASDAGRGAAGTAPTRELDDLDELLRELTDAVAAVEDSHGGPLAAGELRVCLDSASPVVDRFGRDRVERFLSDLRTVVTDRSGIGHVVLPTRPVPDRYEWLADPFDAVVEARSVEGVPHERWELPGAGHRTEWFPVAAAGVE